MKKRKLNKEDLDKMGDLNLDKVLDEISKINWDCLIRKTTRHLSRELCLFIKFFHKNLLQFI